jgi:hypothetical protein
MKHIQHYNSPGAVAWLFVAVLVIVATVLTADLIRDKVQKTRQQRAELTALLAHKRRVREDDRAIFNTVREAQHDFR